MASEAVTTTAPTSDATTSNATAAGATAAATTAADATASAADDPATLVRRWLLQNDRGTLCTLSTAHELGGFPVGSIVPYALDAKGRPFVLLADIAEHTRAAEADPRASLFVAAPPDPAQARHDPQSNWRFNIAGHLVRLRRVEQNAQHEASREALIDDDTDADLWARYIERVPSAAGYNRAHAFYFWRLEPLRVRVIAGFGRIHWVKGDDVLRPATDFASGVTHMNEDHAANILEMVDGLANVQATSARLVAIDAGGLTVETTGPAQRFHFSFLDEVDGPRMRRAVIDVLHRARAAKAARA